MVIFNLTGHFRDKGLLGYDLEINVPLKPSTITDSPKRLGGCNLSRGFLSQEIDQNYFVDVS